MGKITSVPLDGAFFIELPADMECFGIKHRLGVNVWSDNLCPPVSALDKMRYIAEFGVDAYMSEIEATKQEQSDAARNEQKESRRFFFGADNGFPIAPLTQVERSIDKWCRVGDAADNHIYLVRLPVDDVELTTHRSVGYLHPGWEYVIANKIIIKARIDPFDVDTVAGLGISYNIDLAARHGSVELVRYFVGQGAKVGPSTMKSALAAGTLDVIRYLVDAHPDLWREVCEDGGDEPLESLDPRTLQFALSNGWTIRVGDLVRFYNRYGFSQCQDPEVLKRFRAVNEFLTQLVPMEGTALCTMASIDYTFRGMVEHASNRHIKARFTRILDVFHKSMLIQVPDLVRASKKGFHEHFVPLLESRYYKAPF